MFPQRTVIYDSRLRFIEPPWDRAKVALITDLLYYAAGLFRKNSTFAIRGGSINRSLLHEQKFPNDYMNHRWAGHLYRLTEWGKKIDSKSQQGRMSFFLPHSVMHAVFHFSSHFLYFQQQHHKQ